MDHNGRSNVQLVAKFSSVARLHAGTIMYVETNSIQFYLEASRCEAAVHPGLCTGTNGGVALDSLIGGYG